MVGTVQYSTVQCSTVTHFLKDFLHEDREDVDVEVVFLHRWSGMWLSATSSWHLTSDILSGVKTYPLWHLMECLTCNNDISSCEMALTSNFWNIVIVEKFDWDRESELWCSRAEPDLEFEGLLKRQHTRVKYFQGSLMNAIDLERAKVVHPQMPQPDYITFYLSLYWLCTLKFWSQWFCDWLKQQKLILIMELWKDKSIKCKCKVNLVQYSPKYSYLIISVYSNNFNFLHNPCSYLHIWNQI